MPAFRAGVYPRRSLNLVKMSDFVALNFHGIGPPERDLEAGEAAYWIGEERCRDILARIAAHPGRARIRITFDDGNISDRTRALPMLETFGLDADFFVLSGRIGQPGSLGEDDIRALRAAGMRIGSHGVRHVAWSGLEPDVLEAELRDSKKRLEEVCGVPVTAAGIPFGRYDGAVLRGLRAAGYDEAWSSDGGVVRERDFPYPRTSIRADTPPARIDAVLDGRMTVLRRARRAAAMTIKRLG